MIEFGKPTYAYESVASTMDVAVREVLSGAPAGTIVRARRQTAGKGRRGRIWSAPPDANLNCTIVCGPVAPDRQWELAPLAGIAVVDALEAVVPGIGARLRFPNDVLLKGRKCAGVLVESVAAPDGSVPLVGIGVNVRSGSLPEDVAARAIAIEDVVGDSAPTVDTVADAVVAAFGAWWNVWRGNGFAAIANAWNERRDTEAFRSFRVAGRDEPCTVAGISEDGRVAVERPDGSVLWVPAVSVVLGDA